MKIIFRVSDWLWLFLLIAVALGWWFDHRHLVSQRDHAIQALNSANAN